jgi:trk system potassium uptake protein TrkH
VATYLLISFEPFSFETNFTAAVACFNNIGPGFDTVGPAGSFAAYSDFSKFVLSFTMLMGRLEVFPLLLTILPSSLYHR